MNKQVTDHIIESVSRVILGKEKQIKLSVACLLAGGHLLIEDLPGTGKTTLATTLAHVLGLQFQRIQFTSDLLPSDILGVSIYNKDSETFKLQAGAIFTHVLLADEINRATPKTQSALLEAMEEQQVSIDGTTHQLPDPFFVIATQNPQHHHGTYPLPESQLDRFLMRISLGYPDTKSERAILQGLGGRASIDTLKTVCDLRALLDLQKRVKSIHASEEVLDYLLSLVTYGRHHHTGGISTRASLGLLQSARAWAMCEGRNFVTPEDIQAVFSSVIAHRIQSIADERITEEMLSLVPIE